MFFIEWWLVGRFCLSLLMIAAAAFLIGSARTRRTRTRSLLPWFSWPLALLGTLFFLLNVLAAGCQSDSPPAYSPDGKMAARVRTFDEGILGSASDIDLFRAHGLSSGLIFDGPWQSVNASSLRWKSDNRLEILYQENVFYCASVFGVRVHCVARPASSP
jgi:hypothetical protein